MTFLGLTVCPGEASAITVRFHDEASAWVTRDVHPAGKRGQLGPAKDGEELPERSATRPSGRKQTDRQIIGVRLGSARREPSPRKDGLREHRRL